MSNSVSSRLNIELLEQQYAQWQADSTSVDEQWQSFFQGFELGSVKAEEEEAQGASLGVNAIDEVFYSKVVSAIYNYRTLGHFKADINPIQEPKNIDRLSLESLGFSSQDLEKTASSIFFKNAKNLKIKDLITELEAVYCDKIGFEFMHIHETEIRHWIRNQIEARVKLTPTKEDKTKWLEWLLTAEMFESFLGKKFLGEKRFSLEGGEGAMVILNALLESCPGQGVKEIEMGMSHRGRLNVLANFVGKSLPTLLHEFTPNYKPDLAAGDGDVKYHLGFESVRKLSDGEVRVSLAANPSHLEAVNAVVEGKARARQRILGDSVERKQVLPILIHGDAAFAGQGPVAEVLNMSQLPGYRTGGTIHLIINNQIGFTTSPEDARSSPYATDVAKMIDAPILHVNGEDPEALVWSAQFALEFRQKFNRDIVLDMYCYRRQGHNETDQAAFTQPTKSKIIASKKPVGQMYKTALESGQDLSSDETQEVVDKISARLNEGFDKMLEAQEKGDKDTFYGSTAELQAPFNFDVVQTGVDKKLLNKVGKALINIPKDFKLNTTLAKRFFPRREEAVKTGEKIDWALAEALAFGTLVEQGYPIRLSGQDCRRGTFSHRHAVLYDAETRERYTPLQNISKKQETFCVYNSLLSEAGVLGFDYGYSLSLPKMLIMWEAQFGDFANGAQVMIDQFISSAESKWQTPSSLVMLLPHGYEGMGPEHSSARLERFLQLCAEKNMRVVNLTTPAQYFHALRRQKLCEFQKPLIVMTPKSLLSKAEAVSSIEDFTEDSHFLEIITDDLATAQSKKVDRVIFCSGKVYYDLIDYRDEQEGDKITTAIIRMEQLYPFHEDAIVEALAPFQGAKSFVWCQEEPLNMGGWTLVGPGLNQLIDGRFKFAGRKASASPAVGSKAAHKQEQADLVQKAFTI